MKKYIIIIVILLSAYKSNSQNSLPLPLYVLRYNPSTTLTQLNVADNPQTSFVSGWQWGGDSRLTEALKMNMSIL